MIRARRVVTTTFSVERLAKAFALTGVITPGHLLAPAAVTTRDDETRPHEDEQRDNVIPLFGSRKAPVRVSDS